jgi:NAD+ synthase
VIGTGNLSEITAGYFTKWGDGACDYNPLANIAKREVYVLAKYLDEPECIIDAKPSAELFADQTDEGELGFTYQQLDDFILDGTSGDACIDYLIKKLNAKTKHKRDPIPVFEE